MSSFTKLVAMSQLLRGSNWYLWST